MKAVIYARISTSEQSEHSLGAQVEECKAYIEKEKYELANVYMDDGYSAKNMNRPQLQQMLNDLKQKKFNIIVIWRLDRLTRDTIDGLSMVKDMFKPNGVEFASVNEDIDTSTPDGFMMFTIRLSIAQNEREKIAERVTLGMRARAQKGLRANHSTPYGYDMSEDKQLVINEGQAEIVRLIHKMYKEGNGKQKIANTLNRLGVPTKLGNKLWIDGVINNILTNPTYYGATRMKPKNREEIIVENTNIPILTKEEFDETQRIIHRKKEGLMSRSSYDFPFSNIVKCGECGMVYHGQQKKSNRAAVSRYYRCRGYATVKGERLCNAGMLSEAKLTELFRRFLNSFEFDALDLNKRLGEKDTAKDIKRITKSIEDSNLKKKNYTRAMGSGKLDYDMFAELMEEENAKIAEWNIELMNLTQMAPNTNRTRRDIINSINDLNQNWESLTLGQKKQFIQNLFDAVIIKKEGKYWHIVGYKLAE